jgi:hypothetical protein
MDNKPSKIYSKLGELLLKERIITQEQLAAVLKQQVIYGTRIGSTLIEMGYVDEEVLAHLLGGKLGVPVAGLKDLMSVPKELIRTFSGELAIKFHVMPLKLERNRLTLAMTDPTDLRAIDEISFITGYVIQPQIALDMNISKALAKYYQFNSAERRYQLMTSLKEMSAAAAPVKPAKVALPERAENSRQLGVVASHESANIGVPEEKAGLNRSSGERTELVTFTKVISDFAAAQSRDSVADSLIRYLGQEFNACAVFIVRGNAAVAWRGMRSGRPIEGFSDFGVLLGKPSVIQDVAESRDSVVGMLQETVVNRQILDAIGLSPESELAVQPIVMLNKTVAVILVAGHGDKLTQRLEELKTLSRKASLAFEMLIIKAKILMP